MRGVSLLVAALCATLADSAMGFLQSPCSGMRPLTATTSRRGSYIARAHSPRRSLVAPGCEIRSGGARPDFGGRPFPVFPVGGKFPSGKRSDALAPYAGRSPEGKIVPVIAVPGGGIYFWWQAGAIKSLQRHYKLQDAQFLGASAGALTACCAAADVDMDNAFEVAARLAKEYQIWDRPQGLMGIWGKIIREWLDEILPENATEMCNGRLSVAVADLRIHPKVLSRRLVSDFEDREDLISACLASVHIPYFLDGKPWNDFRGKVCIDGSVTSMLRGKSWHVKTGDPTPTMQIEYKEDGVLADKNWGFLETISEQSFAEMFNCGYNYMEDRHESGSLVAKDAAMQDILLVPPSTDVTG